MKKLARDHADEIIGTTWNADILDSYDWSQTWPAVATNDGNAIRGLLDCDDIPENATMLAWSPRSCRFIPTDGRHGFDAVDYYSY